MTIEHDTKGAPRARRILRVPRMPSRSYCRLKCEVHRTRLAVRRIARRALRRAAVVAPQRRIGARVRRRHGGARRRVARATADPDGAHSREIGGAP